MDDGPTSARGITWFPKETTVPKLLTTAFLGGLALAMAGPAAAADDPSIKGELRASIQAAMSDHVRAQTLDGDYVLYDAVDGQLLRLRFDAMHAGIVRKGNFYVSCADFTAADGTYYDLDMLVADHPTDGMRVLQAIVHKKGDDKRQYHVHD